MRGFLSPLARVRRSAFYFLCFLCANFWITPAGASDAEIVMVVGQCDFREDDSVTWRSAIVKQKIEAGSFVRTGRSSQMALVLKDQTQVRLNQDSILQIKAASGDVTRLELTRGRVWAQAKQALASFFRVSRIRLNTPTATIGIRGTDWEVDVGPRGETMVTVLSGEIELANEHGMVAVGPNEQAIVESGKAPIKRYLSAARDRVQWVSSYRPNPARWVPMATPATTAIIRTIVGGEYGKALAVLEGSAASLERDLLLADLYLFSGKAADAVVLLADWSIRGGGDPMATALAARALTISGKFDEARNLLLAGLAKYSGHVELSLALADLARLEGSADEALGLFSAIARADPSSHEAWFGIGRIENEKENVGAARRALGQALTISPEAPGVRAEMATVEAFSGNLNAARRGFEEVLEKQPDDVLALAGLGIVQLKSGEISQAVETYLRAGVIEPRFARVQLFTGVAYYQAGNRQRAIEFVRKAAELDVKDPLPHVMLGLMLGDQVALGESIEAAQEAQERMPYLKSVNQIQNNQRGTANLGSSLAAMGLDEWAQAQAADSYNPYWGASHLFQADRLPDSYNKNSELYQGFLTDPTAFGASNRYSSILTSPGNYGHVGLLGETGDFEQEGVQVAANGLSAKAFPIAYSVVGERAHGQTEPGDLNLWGNNGAFGLGARPTHELGLFLFGTGTDVDGQTRMAPEDGLTDDLIGLKIARGDLGLTYRIGPKSHLWFKYGSGSQETNIDGALFSQSLVDDVLGQWPTEFCDPTLSCFPATFSGFFGGLNPAGRLEMMQNKTKQTDTQIRYLADLRDGVFISFGYDRSNDRRNSAQAMLFSSAEDWAALGLPGPPLARLALRGERRLRSDSAYLGMRLSPVDSFELQVDVSRQRLREDAAATISVDLDPTDTASIVGLDATGQAVPALADVRRITENNPRLGVRFSPAPGHQIRAVYQKWRKPVSTGTLAPVDTLGIPLEDRLVGPGGKLTRSRVQYDISGGKAFGRVYIDRRQVENLESDVEDIFINFDLTELDAIRSRRPVFNEAHDPLEDTPEFGKGEVDSAGLATNWLVTRSFTLAGRYIWSRSRNEKGPFEGKSLPLLPRHYANLSGYWQPGGRWLLGVESTWRSQRYRDDEYTEKLTAGVTLGLKTYWETDDKRWSAEISVDNLHTDKRTAYEDHAQWRLNTLYRF